MKRMSVAVSLCLAVMSLAACKGPEEGTSYIAGTYSGVVSATLPIAVEATVDALEDLRMTIAHKEVKADQTSAKVIARTDQNVRVSVEVFPTGDASSTVKIRVGLSGDQQYSHAIFRNIKGKL